MTYEILKTGAAIANAVVMIYAFRVVNALLELYSK